MQKLYIACIFGGVEILLLFDKLFVPVFVYCSAQFSILPFFTSVFSLAGRVRNELMKQRERGSTTSYDVEMCDRIIRLRKKNNRKKMKIKNVFAFFHVHKC